MTIDPLLRLTAQQKRELKAILPKLAEPTFWYWLAMLSTEVEPRPVRPPNAADRIAQKRKKMLDGKRHKRYISILLQDDRS